PNGHVGRSPNRNGSSLVYNHRTTTVGGQTVVDPETGVTIVLPTHQGPIHDPTALIYMRTSDLTPFTVLSAAELTAFDIASQLTVTTSTVSVGTTTTTGTATLSAADLTAVTDPTAITVNTTTTLITLDAGSAACLAGGATNLSCPVVHRGNVPIEPVVLRAA